MATHQWDAQTYDRISDPQVRWGSVVLDRLRLRGDERVLDAGCGTGRVSEQLLERLPRGRLIGLDADAAMIAEARDRLSRFGDQVELVVANLLDPLPVAEPVDAIFSTAAFHWVKDHDTLFRNLAAVVKAGGQLVVQCGGADNIASVLRAIRLAGDDSESPWCFAGVEDTTARLEAAGFVAARVWLYDEPTPFASVEDFRLFLEKMCLGPYLACRPESEHAAFVDAVVANMPAPEIDYVRLNIVASRAG